MMKADVRREIDRAHTRDDVYYLGVQDGIEAARKRPFPMLTDEEWASVERICNRFIGDDIEAMRRQRPTDEEIVQASMEACWEDHVATPAEYAAYGWLRGNPLTREIHSGPGYWLLYEGNRKSRTMRHVMTIRDKAVKFTYLAGEVEVDFEGEFRKALDRCIKAQ